MKGEIEWLLSLVAVLGTGTFWCWFFITKIAPRLGFTGDTLGEGVLTLLFIAAMTVGTLSAISLAAQAVIRQAKRMQK